MHKVTLSGLVVLLLIVMSLSTIVIGVHADEGNSECTAEDGTVENCNENEYCDSSDGACKAAGITMLLVGNEVEYYDVTDDAYVDLGALCYTNDGRNLTETINVYSNPFPDLGVAGTYQIDYFCTDTEFLMNGTDWMNASVSRTVIVSIVEDNSEVDDGGELLDQSSTLDDIASSIGWAWPHGAKDPGVYQRSGNHSLGIWELDENLDDASTEMGCDEKWVLDQPTTKFQQILNTNGEAIVNTGDETYYIATTGDWDVSRDFDQKLTGLNSFVMSVEGQSSETEIEYALLVALVSDDLDCTNCSNNVSHAVIAAIDTENNLYVEVMGGGDLNIQNNPILALRGEPVLQGIVSWGAGTTRDGGNYTAFLEFGHKDAYIGGGVSDADNISSTWFLSIGKHDSGNISSDLGSATVLNRGGPQKDQFFLTIDPLGSKLDNSHILDYESDCFVEEVAEEIIEQPLDTEGDDDIEITGAGDVADLAVLGGAGLLAGLGLSSILGQTGRGGGGEKNWRWADGRRSRKRGNGKPEKNEKPERGNGGESRDMPALCGEGDVDS